MGLSTQVSAAPRQDASLDSIKRYDRMFFGHPLGLLVLSMNEMWERFSFYGLRTILVLFMIASEEKGGMALSYAEAAAVYGIYSCLNGVMILPGGWIADALWGQRRALLWGGIVITLGHLCMAVKSSALFFSGLGLIVLGTGLLKPASTLMVSRLYRPDDPRQESGYTIYYMCINVGAMLGALTCGYLGQRISWHYGFGAAAVGMIIGLLVYIFGARILGPVGKPSGAALDPVAARRNYARLAWGTAGGLGLIAVLAGGNATGLFSVTFNGIVKVLGFVMIGFPILYFIWLLRDKQWSEKERRHLRGVAFLFAFSILFAAAADQSGFLMMLFAEERTNCSIGSWSFPSTWFASLNGALIILISPFFGWLWPALKERNPSVPGKFAWAMFFTFASFVVMVVAAWVSGSGEVKVGPWWLFSQVALITCGEMFLGPVGISAFARLAPRSIASQMMAVWFMKGAVSGLLASYAGGAYGKIPLTMNFGISASVLLLALIVILITTPKVKRWMVP